jgi:hypothetical protein
MSIAPGLQTGINTILVRIHPCPWHDGVFDDGFNGLLLHIRKQIDDHLPTALHHPKDGRSFFLSGTTATFALESASTTLSALAFDHLWLSFMASNHIGFIALHLLRERHRGLFFRSLHAVVPSSAAHHCH